MNKSCRQPRNIPENNLPGPEPGYLQIKQASKEVQRSLEEIPGAPRSRVQKTIESLTGV